ncbi:serine hydrolase domain-containing protein [Candidatus Rariloculus sp.]|uniref:serine hydrolase domain-containing protein n=1 Tax=Candidatus Rariloculus sp. TaxID=3101265 RepID=UPI003D13ACCF
MIRPTLLFSLLAAFSVFALTGCSPAPESIASAAIPLEGAAPESVGFSSERLERLTQAMQQLVDDGELSGAITMIARHGQPAHFEAVGRQNIESDIPMAPDSIFRIYSMTKPITGVAMMMLHERGKWGLNDPVSRHIPEFENLRVAVELEDGTVELEDAVHPPTMRELMSHTGGFSYGNTQTVVDAMYRDVDILFPHTTMQQMIDDLARIPLQYQPGSRWLYSVSVDIQGYLVEKLSGQPFPEFLQEHIFEPLGMTDTAFHVPEEKRDRFVEYYAYGENRALTPTVDRRGRTYLDPDIFPSGGGGLVSTAEDYMRFSQMLLNGGEFDGVRILSPQSVDLMRANHLPQIVAETSPGTGFGLDFAITMDPVRSGSSTGAGTYYWAGAAGTWFWIDPTHDLVFVGMIQQTGSGRPNMRALSTALTYAALVDPDR